MSQLPNGELEGKKAVITGWNNGQLQKATVNILKNKELESSVSSLINRILEIDSRFLCSAAVPEVLTEKVKDFRCIKMFYHVYQSNGYILF